VAICVDPLVKWSCGVYPYGPTRGKSCHLFTNDGDLDALHELAASVGLRREWFQNDELPHYDLSPNKRDQAVAAGAIEVDRRYAIWLRRKGKRHSVIAAGVAEEAKVKAE